VIEIIRGGWSDRVSIETGRAKCGVTEASDVLDFLGERWGLHKPV